MLPLGWKAWGLAVARHCAFSHGDADDWYCTSGHKSSPLNWRLASQQTREVAWAQFSQLALWFENMNRFAWLAIIWLASMSLVGFLYHYINGWDSWKLIVIFAEFTLTIAISLLIMRKDIGDILATDHMAKIFDLDKRSPANGSTEKLMMNFLTYFIIFFLFASAILLIFVVIELADPEGFVAKLPLIVKTVISIIIALGCVLIFGKTTIRYAIDYAFESTHRLVNELSQPSSIQRYEYMRQFENHIEGD